MEEVELDNYVIIKLDTSISPITRYQLNYLKFWYMHFDSSRSNVRVRGRIVLISPIEGTNKLIF